MRQFVLGVLWAGTRKTARPVALMYGCIMDVEEVQTSFLHVLTPKKGRASGQPEVYRLELFSSSTDVITKLRVRGVIPPKYGVVRESLTFEVTEQ